MIVIYFFAVSFWVGLGFIILSLRRIKDQLERIANSSGSGGTFWFGESEKGMMTSRFIHALEKIAENAGKR